MLYGVARAAEGATDEAIAQTLHLGISTVHRTRQRFVDEGLMAALHERSRSGSPLTLTGKQAVFLVALACSTPPAGCCWWTVQLLADRFIELRPWKPFPVKVCGASLKKRPQTVATSRMVYSQYQSRGRLAYEHVLDLYAEPDDPRYPQVCFDESPVQFASEPPSPTRPPGEPARYDCEYKREGTANLFRSYSPCRVGVQA